MGHLVTAFFFGLVLTGAAFTLYLTVRHYWAEILAALQGELPVRHVRRPWSRVRSAERPRPLAVAVRAQQPRHAAS